jgi:hypothetical protein
MSRIAALQSQLAVRQAYVTYYDARIRSGVYKTRKVQKGIDGPYKTEEELLADELATMLRHIHLMNELSDEICGAANP